jgi:hypothetical protein
VVFGWLTYTQPLEALQESVVHGLLSLQVTAGPPLHVPPEQLSFWVQTLPSEHGLVLLLYTQPAPLPLGLQESSVQGLLSLQVRALPPPQTREESHLVLTVQALPSSQAAPTPSGLNTQPVAGLQLSAVQTLPSLQVTGLPMQVAAAVPLQWSPVVQALLSLQVVVPGRGVFTHPPAEELQVSAVQGLLSLQFLGVPLHTPPPSQPSLTVQGSPSSQAEPDAVNFEAQPSQPGPQHGSHTKYMQAVSAGHVSSPPEGQMQTSASLL